MRIKQLTIGSFLLLSIGFQSCKDDSLVNPVPAFKGEVNWAKALGGSGEDELRKAIPTSDGGMALFGFSASTDGNISDKTLAERDYWLVKTAMDGTVQWSKTYGGTKDDRGRDLIQTPDGGFALVGYSMSSDGDASKNEGQHDNWIVRTDANGEIMWERSYGFAGHDHAYGIVGMEDGGYAMAGFLDIDASQGAGSDGRGMHGIGEYWVHRLNPDGSIKWRRFFGGTNNDRIHALLKAPNGGLLLAGFTESNDFDITENKGEYEFWLVRIDANGNMLWQRTYGGSGIDIVYGATNGPNNTYLIAGSTVSENGDISSNKGNTDAWVIKVDDTGQLVWEQTYGGTGFDAVHAITSSASGGYWLTGTSRSEDLSVPNKGENDFWIVKIDEQGTVAWERTVGGSGIDFAYGIMESPEGLVNIIGTSESIDGDVKQNHGGQDAWIVQWK